MVHCYTKRFTCWPGLEYKPGFKSWTHTALVYNNRSPVAYMAYCTAYSNGE